MPENDPMIDSYCRTSFPVQDDESKFINAGTLLATERWLPIACCSLRKGGQSPQRLRIFLKTILNVEIFLSHRNVDRRILTADIDAGFGS